MSRGVVGALRVVLVVVLVGTVLTQVLLLPLMASDVVATFPEAAGLRAPTLALTIAGVGTLQVAAAVCLWRLVTMAGREAVFTTSAVRVVDVLVGAACLAAALAVAQLVVLVVGDAQTPGAMLAVLAALVAGVGAALLLLVVRGALGRAVVLKREVAARHREPAG